MRRAGVTPPASLLSLFASDQIPSPRETYVNRPLRLPKQLEIASTVQTIPQDTGFFTILGPFLVDMSIELTLLLWFFLRQMVWPTIRSGLVLLATPILVGLSLLLMVFPIISDIAVLIRPDSRAAAVNRIVKDQSRSSRSKIARNGSSVGGRRPRKML
jgi:hypothetical protein